MAYYFDHSNDYIIIIIFDIKYKSNCVFQDRFLFPEQRWHE